MNILKKTILIALFTIGILLSLSLIYTGYWVIINRGTENILTGFLCSLFGVCLVFMFSRYVNMVYYDKTKADGSHLHPIIWIIMGVLIVIMPIQAIFTGYFNDKHYYVIIMGLAYLLWGSATIRSGLIRLRKKKHKYKS